MAPIHAMHLSYPLRLPILKKKVTGKPFKMTQEHNASTKWKGKLKE